MAIIRTKGKPAGSIRIRLDMNRATTPTDSERTLKVIEGMKNTKIGKYKKWKGMIKKIRNRQPLSPEEQEYYSNITRIYKNSVIATRSRIYHTRLSELDEKPPCWGCGKDSAYYCNMNDQYFCMIHIVGHDENEV